MHNILFTIGPVTVYGYGLMIAIGIISAYFMAEYRAKRLGLNSDMVFPLVIYLVAFGFLFSKLLYCATQIPVLLSDPQAYVLSIKSGWVIYGGILGGIFGGWLCCRHYKVSLLDYLDLAAPSCALAQGFGRIGCLLAGCCYGIETSSPFHIVFHTSEYAPNGIPLFPTEPVSSVLDFLNCLLLLLVARRTDKRGAVAGTFLTTYSAGRFILEFFRGDLIRGKVGILTTSQFIGIFTFIAGILILAWSTKRGVKRGTAVHRRAEA